MLDRETVQVSGDGIRIIKTRKFAVKPMSVEEAVQEVNESKDEFLVIGEGIMEINPHLRLVLRKSGQVSGTFRTREYEAIAGEGDSETVHEEFSCLFRLDVTKVYFNPRLSHERMRVARQIKEGERVLDMFAGVGPYSILIAKTQRDSQI